MEIYSSLINKKIMLCFNNDIINSYEIKTIRPTDRFMTGIEGSGRIFNCDIDWQNKEISGGNEIMEFPKSVFDDLINNGCAKNPMIPNMYFKIDDKKHN